MTPTIKILMNSLPAYNSKTIPLKDITKIEVQDGKKNFNYVER